MPGSQVALGPGDVHVWTTSPDAIRDPELLEAYRRLLSAEERAREQRFRFEKGRRECLVSRALVRTVLSGYADVDPREWKFVENEHGRPDLVPEQRSLPLSFNLSHTDGLIACAVTLDRPIGVDVEALDRRGATVEAAEHYFSPSEACALRALPAEGQRERFFTYWTLKEAYIKARGLGLSLPLEQFSLDVGGCPIRIAFEAGLDDDPLAWQFELLRPTDRHMLAVGVRRGRGPDLAIRVQSTVPLAGSSD